MRFKKGSKVEVMNKNEVPTSWHLAEIISGNGHTYNLRYDCYPGVEKVSRKFIRPCPPLAEGTQSWVTGDIVEVFDDNAWKTATVSELLGGRHFLVRIHGLTHEIKVDKLHIRPRQSWRDGQWLPIRKISGSYGDMKSSKMVANLGFQEPLTDAKIHKQENNCLPVYNDAGLQESHVVSSKTLKRASPFCSSFREACLGEAKKFKAIEKEHDQRLISGRALEKVDAFAYPRETLGNKYMQASFNNNASLNGYYEMEKGKSNGVVGCSLARISEPNDSDNDQCSVGSCSVSGDDPNKFSSHYIAVTSREMGILSGDAESFNTSRAKERNCSPPPEKEVAASIHRLELHAYRSTLEALYASGPLSWEKEALLTNLRINLHISNDEHLSELKHLISPAAGILDYQ